MFDGNTSPPHVNMKTKSAKLFIVCFLQDQTQHELPNHIHWKRKDGCQFLSCSNRMLLDYGGKLEGHSSLRYCRTSMELVNMAFCWSTWHPHYQQCMPCTFTVCISAPIKHIPLASQLFFCLTCWQTNSNTAGDMGVYSFQGWKIDILHFDDKSRLYFSGN